MKIKLLLITFLFSLNTYAHLIPLDQRFLNAIGQQESGMNPGAMGDYVHGKATAIGIFQIHKQCFIDAQNYNKDLINYKWEDCLGARGVNVSIVVITSYLNRYENKSISNNDYESLAKCWNGGCNWRNKTGKAKENLDKYWQGIKEKLK